jgi:hypothetical protein
MNEPFSLQNTLQVTSDAVARYWITRRLQHTKQEAAGRSDQGTRGSVTGGAQMHGFIELFTRVVIDAGIAPEYVFSRTSLEIPGYFRPTKEWDLLVVMNGMLIAAIEAKSQVGPSFGNNFNNRTEEAMGSALDVWTAFREGAFNTSPLPFLGYFFMLEDTAGSQMPVKVREPHFSVFPEFVNASYTKRYELFCRKLVRERHYSAAAFITSQSDTGLSGEYAEPAPDLSMLGFVRSLAAHVSIYV